jgi:photosystem II stability/assembly factor-like uncharacterized protein
MRYLVPALLLFISFDTSAQFKWSNPQPAGYYNERVVFTDATTGYIINHNGDLIKTTNAGVSWNILKNFPYCNAMEAKDSIIIVGGSDSSINISMNNGQSWNKRPLITNGNFQEFHIINRDTFYAVSNYMSSVTKLYRSTNQGQTWQLIHSSPPILKCIDFVNSQVGFATSFGGVFKTTNGGASWQNVWNQPNAGPGFPIVKFYDANLGYAWFSNGSFFVKTTDGGLTWTSITGYSPSTVMDIAIVDPQKLFIVGEYGWLERSFDGGATWQLCTNWVRGDYDLSSIVFVNQTTGFAVGHRGRILKTVDGGFNWQDYATNYADLEAMSFPTDSIGYFATWWETFKTTNGGQSWNKLPLTLTDQTDRFRFMHFFSKDTGIAVAHNRVQFYKTYNGGQSWQTLILPGPYREYAGGFFVVKNTIYLNTNDGSSLSSMLRSNDRGETWQTVTLNSSHNQRNLFFLDEKTGYGSMGSYLYKTIDSAKTWQLVRPFDYTINVIQFVDSLTGFMATSSECLKTTDGGVTWNIMPTDPNYYEVFGLRFLNKKIGYISAKYTGVYRTIDGGASWKYLMPVWNSKLIEFTKDSSVYVGGIFGSLVKSDMRGYDIDSISLTPIGLCGVTAKAKVSAILTSVDSIWVEYGTASYMRILPASPFSISDTTVKAEVNIPGLTPDSLYQMRLKIFTRGNYYYSGYTALPAVFGIPRPTVSFTAGMLNSSAGSGNQWYLNNVFIPGATQQSFQPVQYGNYTVKVTSGGCTSAASIPYAYGTTAIINIGADRVIRVWPNPFSDKVYFEWTETTAQFFDVELSDGNGKTVLKKRIYRNDVLETIGLPAGFYFGSIRNERLKILRLVKLVKQ